MAYGPFNAGGGSKNKTIGSGAPTTSTVGKVGQDYFDRTTGTTYTCVAVSGSTYTWEIAGTKDASKIEIGEGAEKTALDLAIRKIEQNAENAKPLNGTTDPAASTKGAVGQTFTNTDTGKIWTCVAADDERGVYTWEVSGGTPKTTELLKGDGTGGVSAATPNVDYTEPWVSTKSYAAGAYCVHNGYLWHNTSGAASTGVEPGTNYNIWNVGYSNPNLLDNPWFTVNQRGKTDYPSTISVRYTLDRWKTENWFIVVHVNDDGTVTITNDHNDSQGEVFEQVLDFTATSAMTLSVMLSDGTIYSGGIYEWIYLNASKTAIIEFSTDKVNFRLSANASITIKAVKLELGSVSTLANDTAPNYVQELAKCQRYFQKFTDARAMSLAANFYQLAVSLLLPVKMRTVPSISVNSIQIYFDGSFEDAVVYTTQFSRNDLIDIVFTRQNEAAIEEGNGYVTSFSAELSADL